VGANTRKRKEKENGKEKKKKKKKQRGKTQMEEGSTSGITSSGFIKSFCHPSQS